MARNSDPKTYATVVAWTYGLGNYYGVLRADDSAVRAIEEAVQIAEGTAAERDAGWRTCQTKARRCSRSRCCGCARCYPVPVAT